VAIERAVILLLCLSGCAYLHECEVRPRLVDSVTLEDLTEIHESGTGMLRLFIACPIPVQSTFAPRKILCDNSNDITSQGFEHGATSRHGLSALPGYSR